MKTILAAFAVLPVFAQDPARPARPTIPTIDQAPHADGDDPHVEMQELFGKIEVRLREIDKLLADASAGGASATSAAATASGKAAREISALIKGSREGSEAVVAGIDRILELANHPHQPGGT